MVQYVYALHDFFPEHEDEVSFRAGERIEVIEKDDQYGDGWWQGRNLSGQFGLFPESYTTPVPPSSTPPEDSQSVAPPALAPSKTALSPKGQLQPLAEESESNTPQVPTPSGEPLSLQLNGRGVKAATSQTNLDDTTRAGAGTDSDYPASDGEMMRATMTDVQKAIEQLGRSKHDPDGTRSFSFSSTRDEDRDTEIETETDTDFEINPGQDTDDGDKGEAWHKGARRKLAERARRAVEEAEKLEMMMSGLGSARIAAPPIEVELSEESEGEDEEHTHHTGKYESGRHHPLIPEEDEDAAEEEESNQREPATATVENRVNVTDDAIEPRARDSPDLQTSVQLLFPESTTSTTLVPIHDSIPKDDKPAQTQTGSVVDSGGILGATAIVTNPGNSVSSRLADAVVRETALALTASTNPLQPQLQSEAQFAGRPSQLQFSPPLSTPTSTLIGQPEASMSSTFPSIEAEKKGDKEKRHPSDWTVEEVVEWLKAKGFGLDICEKFIEQEITGDVLLELDATLLKTEIGVMAFGKRVRIANAIAELRRPPSITYSDRQQSPQSPVHSNPYAPAGNSPSHSRSQSQTQSQAYSYTQSQGFTLVASESAPSNGDILGSHTPLSFTSSHAVNGTYVARELGNQVLAGSFAANDQGAVGLGLTTMNGDRLIKNRPAQLNLSPSDTALHQTAQAVSGPIDGGEDDRAVMSENEVPQRSPAANMRRRLFGRSRDSTESAKGKDKRSSDPPSSKIKDFSPKPSPTNEGNRDVSSVTSRHSRGKWSIDTGKPTDRLSLFGNTFAGPLVRSRKPPPKYSGGPGEVLDPQMERSSNSISRLYREKRPSLRGKYSDASSADKMKVNSSTRTVRPNDSELSPGKNREGSLLRKRSTPASPTDAGNSPREGDFIDMDPLMDQLEPGRSIMEQVGEPDFSGWMRKKGDRYNSWKMRYFILKGPHLYCLRSNNKAETKIKGYVNIMGYKVIADENVDPGRYAFKIVHEHDKTHYFSSDEQKVIREWMKAIMKATIGRDYTKPVISSCNIPTIPLVVAQAMNPAPRPPSPSARDATQKALRRGNPNQLSSRDARVLMGLPQPPAELKEHEQLRLDSFFVDDGQSVFDEIDTSQPPTLPPLSLSISNSPSPTRLAKEKEARKVSSRDELTLSASDRSLIEWANLHLPFAHRIMETRQPLCGGLTLLRLAESIRGRAASPPVPDSAFPSGPNDDRLDGLFKLFDFLLDCDIKMGAVSINDVRHGKRDKILQLLRAMKTWDDKRRIIAHSLGKSPTPS